MNHFHDTNGWLLVGLDQHFGIHWPTPIASPMFFWELVFLHPYFLGGTQAATVQLNGGHNAALDQYVSHVLWLHLPIMPDMLNMLFPLDLLLGKHKTWLPRGAVVIEGKPAAITLFPGPLSVDMDCWTGSSLPSSISLQPGTVVTTPSWADYGRAAVRLAVEIVLYIIARGRAVKARYPDGKLPPPPSHYDWRHMARNIGYVFRQDMAGQRARSTFRNTMFREFMSRTLPFDVVRKGGRVSLQQKSIPDGAKWVMKKLGLDRDMMVRSLASGNPPVPTGWSAIQGKLKGAVPGYKAVEGWHTAESSGQVDWNPFK